MHFSVENYYGLSAWYLQSNLQSNFKSPRKDKTLPICFFHALVLPPCTLLFLVQKLQLKTQKNCRVKCQTFQSCSCFECHRKAYPQVLIWLGPLKIIIEIGYTKIPVWPNMTFLFPPSAFQSLLYFPQTFQLPQWLHPSLILPSHLLSTWVRLATYPNCRKLHRCFDKLATWKAYRNFC